MHVVIIGSGWAGCAAAIGAAELGWKVTLVEGRPYIGGRSRSFADRHTGDVLDNGQHVMIGAYTSALRVMQTLGTDELLERQKGLTVVFADSSGHRDVLDASRFPGKLGMVAGILSMQGLPLSSRYACLRLASQILRKQAKPGMQTCRQWLDAEQQPADAVTRFWEPLVLATLNAPLHQAPAALLVNVLFVALSGGRAAASLWIPTVGLTELLSPIGSWLEQHHSAICLNVQASKLVHEGGSGWRVETDASESIHADAVICAIPQRSVERLLQTSHIQATLPQRSIVNPIVSVYLWYDKAWADFDFSAALGTSIQWVFNKHRIKPGLIAVTISAAATEALMTSDEIVQLCHHELGVLFAQARTATLLHGQVIKEKQATMIHDPGELATLPGGWTRPLPGLMLCGDWTFTALPGTIEAAARSGFRAANALDVQPNVV